MRLNGYFDAAIYVIIQSLSFVFLNKFCKNIDPVIALFAMSFIALIVFNFMNFGKIKTTYTACFENKLLYLVMSIGLAIDWVCMLYSSVLADPFISMSGLFIFLAIIGFFHLFLKNKSWFNLFSVVLLMGSVLILYFGYRIDSSQKLGPGVILGALAGIAFYVYIASSGKLARQSGLSTIQVLAIRFWVLFIGAAFFVPYHNLLSTILNNILSLILVSFGSLIIPIYFSQQAIQKLGSTTTAVCISFTPPITYLFYVIYNHNIDITNVIVCLIITLALVLPYLKKC